MNKGDIYTNNCDGKQITYTILDVDGDMLVVHSNNLDRTYVLHNLIFRDTMQALRFILQDNSVEDGPARYRIYYINNQYYSGTEYEYINQAIEAGKKAGFEFRIELGKMICASWSPLGGLRFYSEYQTWRQNQEVALMLAQGEV